MAPKLIYLVKGPDGVYALCSASTPNAVAYTLKDVGPTSNENNCRIIKEFTEIVADLGDILAEKLAG